ncbi:Resolvase [Caballeronia sordidicola]|uniref:Resolvase n=1 Tax=Caballeronia sordidicola TaxID=196367 RepID=A0A242MRV2_CABSO|nr:Resolvase [Caballeronia sordidicola]
MLTGAFLIGYARVSTRDQDLSNQEAQLRAAGCGKVFAEKITGTRRARPQLDRMLDHLRAGDVIVVTRLDRLARSIRDLLDIVEQVAMLVQACAVSPSRGPTRRRRPAAWY